MRSGPYLIPRVKLQASTFDPTSNLQATKTRFQMPCNTMVHIILFIEFMKVEFMKDSLLQVSI